MFMVAVQMCVHGGGANVCSWWRCKCVFMVAVQMCVYSGGANVCPSGCVYTIKMCGFQSDRITKTIARFLV